MATSVLQIGEQLSMFEPGPEEIEEVELYELLPLEEYDEIVIMFSGGKDSVKMALDILDSGIPLENVRLWHQCIDGNPHHPNPLMKMDWPCTERYCKLFAERFGFKIEFQWREGGFAGELLRCNRLTKPVSYEYDGKIVTLAPAPWGVRNTRFKWPAQSANLASRWCSGALKIDVASRVMADHPDFDRKGIKILVLTGERREESAAREKYAETLPYRLNSGKRRADQWRMVIDSTEEEVWDAMRRHDVKPHPAYLLGYSRVSCWGCIFNGPDHWAMMNCLSPENFEEKAQMEEYIGFKLDHKMTLREKAALGSLDRLPLDDPHFAEWARWALVPDALTLEDMTGFVMPAGAFGGHEGGSV